MNYVEWRGIIKRRGDGGGGAGGKSARTPARPYVSVKSHVVKKVQPVYISAHTTHHAHPSTIYNIMNVAGPAVDVPSCTHGENTGPKFTLKNRKYRRPRSLYIYI